MPFELTAEELALLTPEEIAGLNEGDGEEGNDNDNQGGDANAGAAADGVDANNDAAAAAAAAAAADAGADDGADAAAAAAAGAATDGAAADADAGQQAAFQSGAVPLIRPGQTDDADARQTDLEKQLDALAEKFDNGDIVTSEFLKQQRSINRELNQIDQERFRSQLSQETTQARAEQTWNDSVASFLNSHPELRTSDLRLQSYDMALRRVTGDDANVGKSDVELLELARQNWAKDLGIEAKPAPAADAGKPKADAKPAKSGTDRPDTPNLAGVPAADGASVDDGRFSGLDRLMDTDPLAFEAALAKLSTADREAYLQFGG